MMERAVLAPTRAASRWGLKTAVAGLAGAIALVAVIGAPHVFSAAMLRKELAAQVRATLGLTVTTSGSVRFDLLPRPHVVAKGLRVTDPSGTISIDASELDGNVRLLPLIVGRVELTGLTLAQPHLTIDLDGRAMPTDSTIGRAMHALSPVEPSNGQSLGTVTLIDGTAILKSKRVPHPPGFDAVNVTIDWPDLESPATLTGSIDIQKTPADVAVWIAQPSGLMRGDHSAVTLSLHSTPLDLAASGDLVSADVTTFRGRLSADTPSAADLMMAAGMPAPAPFAGLTLASDATIAFDPAGRGTLDLPDLHLHADDNDYEGTLAFQGGDTPLVSGTLASDQLNLAPFLNALPVLVGPDNRWTQAPVGPSNVRPIDLDLRVSASHLRLDAYTIDDAALSVMTRDARTEVGLIDGKIYGGIVNGHISFGQSTSGQGSTALSLRGAGSLADVDAASLSWDMFGRQLMAGTLSASVNLESTGATPAALMASLGGTAKLDLHDGELSTIDLARALHPNAATGRPGLAAALEAGRTPLDTFDLGLRIVDGLATIERGAMRGSEANLDLAGAVDIAHRSVALTANAKTPDTPGTVALEVAGPFGRIVVHPAGP